jgi:hypothetical protein
MATEGRQAREPERELPTDVPRRPSGLPDDRFDGTDSGPGGWDTPYPPTDQPADDAPAAADQPADAAPPAADQEDSGHQQQRPVGGSPKGSTTAPNGRPINPATAVAGDSYPTDGPDEPVDRPQR